MPAQSIVRSNTQKRDVSPRILSIANRATTAPIAVRWVLMRAKGSEARQKSSHNTPAIAILRKMESEGAFIIVMAHNI